MFRVLFLTLAALIAKISADDFTETEGLLILNKSSLEIAVKEHEFIAVEFYAPWCPQCRLFAPEYAKAAAKLKEDDSPIRLAKFDPSEVPDFGKVYDITLLPTIKFFRKGEPIIYTGRRHSDDLVRWLKKNSGPPAVDLKSTEEADAFKDLDEVTVIGFFKDQESDEAKEYLKVALAIEDLRFGITSEKKVFAHYKVKKDGIVLFKKFDEGRNDFEGELNEENIDSFIAGNRLPLVFEFDKDTSAYVFSSELKNHIILFLKKQGGNDIIKVFRDVAQDFKKKFLFIYVDTKNEDNSRLLEYFGVKEEIVPTVRLISLVDGSTSKYWPKSEGADASAIRKFIQDFQAGDLSPQLMSEEIPEDWDSKPVKVLVGKNFKEVAFNKDNAVFVKFYAPWCEYSKQLAPTWEKLGDAYKDNDQIVIAKIDATVNEIENISLEGFPTLIYFPRGNDQVIDYNGKKTLEALKKFLDSDGKEVVPEEEKRKEDKEEKDKEPETKEEKVVQTEEKEPSEEAEKEEEDEEKEEEAEEIAEKDRDEL